MGVCRGCFQPSDLSSSAIAREGFPEKQLELIRPPIPDVLMASQFTVNAKFIHVDSSQVHQEEEPFPRTRWSIVANAKGPRTEETNAAWSTLIESYWFPLYAFARRKGQSAEDAKDATQSFFVAFMERHSLDQANAERGRLRAFLLAAFKNHMVSAHRKEVAEKRGGAEDPLSLDVEDAEVRLRGVPPEDLTPEREFDRRWALQLMESTLDTLREEFASRGKAAQFDAFKPFLSCETGRDSHKALAKQLDMKEGAIRIAIFRARQRFGQILRSKIADTVTSAEEVEQEIHYLFEVFSG